jgi:hypothetical protein
MMDFETIISVYEDKVPVYRAVELVSNHFNLVYYLIWQ